jgi:hypothetical protein
MNRIDSLRHAIDQYFVDRLPAMLRDAGYYRRAKPAPTPYTTARSDSAFAVDLAR